MKRSNSKKSGDTASQNRPDDLTHKPETSEEDDMDSSARLSDERYRAFIENISDGVYETDIYGNFSYFNNALCDTFGYPREEIQWQNYSKFMEKKRARKVYEIFNKIWITRKGFSDLVWEIVDKEGKTRIIELSANLITNQKGKKLGFRGIARDVT